jgi:hypothetical protein
MTRSSIFHFSQTAQDLFENFLELVPDNTIDNEVGRSIADKGEIAEAGETEEPCGRDKLVTTTAKGKMISTKALNKQT